jgi:phage head maturation protease
MSTPAPTPLREVRDLPPAARPIEFRRETWNETARTIDVVFARGSRVQRLDLWTGKRYEEELDMSPGSVDLSRLNAGAQVLDSHQSGELRNILGVVVEGSARLEGGAGVATIRFSERDDVAGIVADIRSGIIRNVSVGYAVRKYAVEEREGALPLYRAVDWQPLEISFVPIPADPAAQSRAQVPAAPCLFERTTPMTDPTTPAAPVAGAVTDAQIRTLAGNARLPDSEIVALQRANETAPFTHDALVAEIGRRWAAQDTGGLQRSFGGGVPMVDARGRITVGRDEGDTLRAGVEAYIDHRLTGRSDPNGPGRQFLGLSMPEVMRTYLVSNGVREAANMTKHDLVARATHVSSDFPALLQLSGQKFLVDQFKEVQSPLKRAMMIRQVSDFREVSSIIMDGPGLLQPTPDGSEVEFTTFSESRQSARVETYANAFEIGRQALINDDLGAFGGSAQKMAEAAAETEANAIAAMLLQGGGDGPVLRDTVRLFSTAATRANKAGSGTAITVDNLGLATAAMRKQMHLHGQTPTNARPRFIVVGADREVAARQVVATTLVPNQTSAINPFAGELEVITDARLTGNAWRLFADPSRFPVMALHYLEGMTTPKIESFDPVSRLGIVFRVIFDFVPTVIDWRGSYLNPGA